jgi:hypothetical protein
MNPLVPFFQGAASMGCLIAGVLFLAYWRDSRDRLFVFFAIAFWAIALNYLLVAAIAPGAEQRHWFYAIRLVGFALILAGIVDKNRRRRVDSLGSERGRATARRADAARRA